MPEVKKQLWGGEFWSDGYYTSIVGAPSSEEAMNLSGTRTAKEFRGYERRFRSISSGLWKKNEIAICFRQTS